MDLPLILRRTPRFVVYGAGQVAARRVPSLLNSGCQVTVVAQQAHADIQQLAERGDVEWQQRQVSPSSEQFDGDCWYVLALDDASLNAILAKQARACGAWVCRADSPDDSDFYFPAVIDRSPVLVTVSSHGTSPALTRYLRQRLDTFLPAEIADLGNFVARWRQRVRQTLPLSQRKSFWRQWMRSVAPERVLARQHDAAESLTLEMLDGKQVQAGEVYLVGAGPGDPDLLTFRALRLIQSADIVFYDRLVGNPILDLLPRDAERYYVGKARSDHAVPQERINQLLVEHSQQGKRVLRLKGGDPFIFGRGGEELETLADAQVPFQVVPGITAAAGCAAYAGIPLTHRDHAQSVRFVTGHLKNGSCDLPWHELAHPDQTLVIYMGLAGLPQICQQLIDHGMSPYTPIGLVENGTRPDQQVHVSTLAQMPAYIHRREIQPPTLTIVGSVVSLSERLNWR
ncbi:uroporphyrinogen-III C-methyltransferase [Bacterioplanes sanyensis]|uniref:Uroporphyrinogen-III C-methyltransferase n=1 Tax=Bacterioplanes sanyensis TaxID=1249553 RepID=A0A222FL85_9GAMM|nr:siroheme synthase CysG [Bacterioplanes sanyensis]ASP39778.1 uroporphyrinogen-III C-methyltransferase [Bacterioplanes sanyensis]